MTGEKEIVEVSKHRKRKVPKYVQKQLLNYSLEQNLLMNYNILSLNSY